MTSPVTTTEAPITITFKAGGGFEEPWLVLRYNSPQEVAGSLGKLFPSAEPALASHDFSLAVGTAAKEFAARAAIGKMANVTQPAPSVPADPWASQPAAPAPATQSYGQGAAAPSDGRTCRHGARVRREGDNDRGHWVGYFCPLPKERKAEQCPADFSK